MLSDMCLFNSGNLEGQSPYMTGDSSCSNCPDDKKSCVNNLCSNGEVIMYRYMLKELIMYLSHPTTVNNSVQQVMGNCRVLMMMNTCAFRIWRLMVLGVY